jgi:uncharacterized protein (DUF885 family)
MPSRTRFALLIALAPIWFVPAGADSAQQSAQVSGDAAFMQLADDYIDHFYLPNNPSGATLAGVHRYDGELEDYGRAARERQIRALRSYQRRFEAADAASLSERVAGDRELLLSNARSELLTLQTIRPWQNNPDTYSSGVANSAFVIMERSFAPPAQRLISLIERERRMPAALAQAHVNLRNPPEIYTRIALEQLPGTIDFFANDLPQAFASVTDAALQARFRGANRAVIAALRGYQGWLQQQVLPHSHGDFRIGAKAFSAKLLDDEMVDTPLDRLLEIGNADLERNQQAFARVARELDPDKSTREVLAELGHDHPPPEQLLATFRSTFDGLIGFIVEHHIITIPNNTAPTLEETPPFMRATSFASMDTPGPFESATQEAYFNVTLPARSWDAKRIDGFMAQFNYPTISNTAVHEAYPGHFVQFLWVNRLDDRVRKLFGANSNDEGWAHYCEQMMLDEGFGQPGANATPAELRRARLLRLGQLQDALLRDARFIVGIRMHTGTMTYEQAIDFFVEQGYQSREVGEGESKRGTSDPTYLYYTLGKLQILKLRADVAAREGASFDLQRFHDDFMRQGWPPIRLVRRALLQDDSPTL